MRYNSSARSLNLEVHGSLSVIFDKAKKENFAGVCSGPTIER
jgi:hypothetical protein